MREITVYSFKSYRQFLKSNFEARRENQSRLTLGSYSKSLGFGSANYAGLIMSGQRNLTIENILQISRALQLTYAETSYFECLVLLEQAESVLEKRYYRRRLSELQVAKPKSTARVSAKLILDEWYFPIAALAVESGPKSLAVERLAELLPNGRAQATAIIQKLVESGILIEDEEKYELNQSHQIFYDTKSSAAKHKALLLKQIELSRKMAEKNYEKGGKFYAHTFTIGEDDFSHYEDRIRTLLSEFTARSDETEPEKIVQLNIQLFRVGQECFRD